MPGRSGWEGDIRSGCRRGQIRITTDAAVAIAGLKLKHSQLLSLSSTEMMEAFKRERSKKFEVFPATDEDASDVPESVAEEPETEGAAEMDAEGVERAASDDGEDE